MRSSCPSLEFFPRPASVGGRRVSPCALSPQSSSLCHHRDPASSQTCDSDYTVSCLLPSIPDLSGAECILTQEEFVDASVKGDNKHSVATP